MPQRTEYLNSHVLFNVPVSSVLVTEYYHPPISTQKKPGELGKLKTRQTPIEFEEVSCLPRSTQNGFFRQRLDTVGMEELWHRVVPLHEYLSATELPDCPAMVCAQLASPNLRMDFLIDNRIRKAIRSALNEDQPFRWPVDAQLLLFGMQFWKLSKEESHYDDQQLRLVFLDFVDKERRKFERLKNQFSGLAGAPVKPKRDTIPEPVRMYVWRRDEGKCVKCGSQERLEYDHIIPVVRGGSSTERNIQLLCERCNRQKSDSI